MTPNAPRASMEGMTMKAKEISECSDIMPKSLKEHQSKIENACLDMIYLFEQALPALLKEAEERTIIKIFNRLPSDKQWANKTTVHQTETENERFDQGYNLYREKVRKILNSMKNDEK